MANTDIFKLRKKGREVSTEEDRPKEEKKLMRRTISVRRMPMFGIEDESITDTEVEKTVPQTEAVESVDNMPENEVKPPKKKEE